MAAAVDVLAGSLEIPGCVAAKERLLVADFLSEISGLCCHNQARKCPKSSLVSQLQILPSPPPPDIKSIVNKHNMLLI